jgi:hypothetical protein
VLLALKFDIFLWKMKVVSYSLFSSSPGTSLGHCKTTRLPAGVAGQHRKPSKTAGQNDESEKEEEEEEKPN